MSLSLSSRVAKFQGAKMRRALLSALIKAAKSNDDGDAAAT